jgi:hypothetical protein
MTPGESAEARIADLGISDPRDLDVEAISLDAGMEVIYQPLNGCEATLVGFVDRAVATIRPSRIRGRERFSIGHELGHWDMHRGQSFQCRVDDADQNIVSDRILEKQADVYAANLLMPSSLFNPVVKSYGTPGFRELEPLSIQFNTSILATALRLADTNTLSVILACYTARGLKWQKPARDVPRRWWLKQTLDGDSFAYDVINSGKQRPILGKQPAEVWFENDDAGNYDVLESSIQGRSNEALVLIYLSEKMQSARYDPNVGQRKYNEFGSYVTRKKS